MFPSLSPKQFSWHVAWPGDNLIFSGGMEATGDASADTDAMQGTDDADNVDEGRNGLAWESHQNSQHDDDEEEA